MISKQDSNLFKKVAKVITMTIEIIKIRFNIKRFTFSTVL